MCEGGCVRSVALALVLKVNHNQDAIACSWKWNGRDAIDKLSALADYIVVMQSAFTIYVSPTFRAKLRIVDVGPDLWGSPMNIQLCTYLGNVVADWARRGWSI